MQAAFYALGCSWFEVQGDVNFTMGVGMSLHGMGDTYYSIKDIKHIGIGESVGVSDILSSTDLIFSKLGEVHQATLVGLVLFQ